MTNFNNWKPHCSSLYNLFVEPQSKKDKENGYLSKTTQSYLLEIAIEMVYGRTKLVETDAMRKGVEVEQASIDLLSQFNDYKYTKNEKQLENSYLIGTPDILSGKSVIDIKSCRDIYTFMTKFNIPKAYEYQLYAYNILSDTRHGYIAYILTNSPEWLIEKEFNKYSFYKPQEEWQELEEQIRRNNIFNDMPVNKRVKLFHQPMQNGIEDRIFTKIEKARNYLNSLTI